jgi:hypothetical protein
MPFLAVMDDPFMFRRLLSILALLAVFSSASLPVAVLQFGVWVKMLDGFYEQTGSLSDAVEWTFNGENRCDGCELVTSLGGRASEVVASSFSQSMDLKIIPIELSMIIISPPSGEVCDEAPSSWCSVAKLVSTPPPRGLV